MGWGGPDSNIFYGAGGAEKNFTGRETEKQNNERERETTVSDASGTKRQKLQNFFFILKSQKIRPAT